MSSCHLKGMQNIVNDCTEILASGDNNPLAHSLKLMQQFLAKYVIGQVGLLTHWM
jgi:hypothetical protein